MAINVLSYPLFGILMPGNFPPGHYTVEAIMVPPGMKELGDPNKYLSNWATLDFNYNFGQ
jgi:hypothetical protein